MELEPQDNLIQGEFWQNKEQVSAAVAGCYASMNQSAFTSRVLMWGELRAEMIVASESSSNNARNMMKNYILPTNNLVEWKSFYATINYCNLVLEFADGAQENDLSFTEQELHRFKAEVLTIRSLVYFILVRNFKEVPLVLTATANSQTDFYPAKSSEADIIAQIITDLNAAVEDLNLGYSESAAHDKGRMTKGAALAILADVYLWNNQFNDCIAACNSIIELGKYNLVESSEWFNQLFFEGNSTEGIFELQFSDINATIRDGFYISTPNYAPYQEIIDLYFEYPSDVRGDKATFDFSGYVFKYAGINNSGFYRASDEFYNNFIFYRYADVLLMQAEAYILSSDFKNLPVAYNLIDQVHQRAIGAPLDASLDEQSLLTALLLERQKEFAFESKRWYDLLRFARRNEFENQQLILDLADIKSGADDYDQILSYYSDSESYFLPIDQNEVNLNPQLLQNPYYEN
ncbi:RagB/SusD family nutrient uptake outer membrane protein [Flavivirga jejuensis]